MYRNGRDGFGDGRDGSGDGRDGSGDGGDGSGDGRDGSGDGRDGSSGYPLLPLVYFFRGESWEAARERLGRLLGHLENWP